MWMPGLWSWSGCVVLFVVRVQGGRCGGSSSVLLFIFFGKKGIVGCMVARLGLPR